ncbi:hypothetical protein OG871_14650 [Kitasatospora sp. NBC_00374]|uniref:hypothetical protein n=1 Tax=Kitasatospora sp. NBC_00374 TaxID=2975964 RepID=UPI00324A03C6
MGIGDRFRDKRQEPGREAGKAEEGMPGGPAEAEQRAQDAKDAEDTTAEETMMEPGDDGPDEIQGPW